MNININEATVKALLTYAALFSLITGALAWSYNYYQSFARIDDLPDTSNFITRVESLENKYEILITILNLKASDYEDKIASGEPLTPIEQNRYEKTLGDIKRYQDKLESLNEE